MTNISSFQNTDEVQSQQDKAINIASLKAIFEPRSVAVIGASNRRDTIGNELFRNILKQDFLGIVYPVNPNADVVASIKTYPSVLDIPGPVDLAIIIVPAETVQQVAEECGQKGVKGIVVISAGFGESGAEGKERQNWLVETCRRYGTRLVGPNCMGVVNTDPKFNLNATFSPVIPPAGKIALGTQSGALGLAILEYTQRLNIGMSTFVSIGNRADVSNNDLLEYWAQDQNTDVILLYLESFGNPRNFARTARSITPSKPIIAVKSGRTPVGSKAAASHTGALATAEVASEALFTQAGIIRMDTMEELFDVANLMSHQPIPAGRKVTILTNAGGPGIMTADACYDRGLELPPLSDKTTDGLKSFLPPRASFSNPIDMTAGAAAEEYAKALKLLLNDDGIDIVVVIFIPPIATQLEEVANAIREIAPDFHRRGKALVASLMASRGTPIELCSKDNCCVPSFTFPEATATALAKYCEYGEWLKRPKGVIPKLEDIDRSKAEQLITAADQNTAQTKWLNPHTVTELLNAYGISTVRSKLASNIEEAIKAAVEIGFPVTVKLLSPTIAHKTEVGGVIIDVRSQEEVERAFTQIEERLVNIGKRSEMQGVVVQQMISGGVEVIVGVTQDPSFGPLIMFGMGGIYTELFEDITFRIHPLTNVDVHEMVRDVKAYQILEGWRGANPSDTKSLEELLLRVSALVEDLPQIAELDLNPVEVLEVGTGYTVVDARVMLS